MTADLEIAEVDATSYWMNVMVALFESYREHYGQPMNLVGSRDWLNSQLASGRLRGYLARCQRTAAPPGGRTSDLQVGGQEFSWWVDS
jgi:hypothetical protein